MNSEAVDAGHVSIITLLRDQGWIDLEYDIVEGSTKVCAINDRMTGGFGDVDIFALRTIQLHSLDVRVVGLSHREQRVRFTHDSRAFAKVRLLVFRQLVDVSIRLKHCA